MSARRITSDWAELFPEFTRWQSLRLLRRIGPVVQGIALDRSGDAKSYEPTVHVHALTRAFPTVSLTLCQRLASATGASQSVDVARHASLYRESAAMLEEQSRLPLRRFPDLREILEAYRESAASAQRGRLPAAIVELEDLVLIPAAAGLPDLSEEGWEFTSGLARHWSPREGPPGWSDAGTWLEWLWARAADPIALETTVHEQISAHRLSAVNVT